MSLLSVFAFCFALLLLGVCDGRDASRCEDADLFDTFFASSTVRFVQAKILRLRGMDGETDRRVVDVMVLQNFKGCKGRTRRTIRLPAARICDISIIEGEEYVFPIRRGIIPKVVPGDVS